MNTLFDYGLRSFGPIEGKRTLMKGSNLQNQTIGWEGQIRRYIRQARAYRAEYPGGLRCEEPEKVPKISSNILYDAGDACFCITIQCSHV